MIRRNAPHVIAFLAFNEKVGHVVVPAYRGLPPDGVVHVGTAILVKTSTKYWIFTAHHVYEACGPIVLGSSPNRRLSGQVVYCKDPLDLAYAEIAPKDIAPILAADMAFLPVELITPESGPLSGQHCVFSGYPGDAVQVDGDEHTSDVTPIRIWSTFASDDTLARTGCDPAIHIGAPITKPHSLDGNRVRKFDPKGLSGGAIWRVKEDGEVGLVGIATHYDPKRKLLIGTRIRLLIEEIARRLQETVLASDPISSKESDSTPRHG